MRSVMREGVSGSLSALMERYTDTCWIRVISVYIEASSSRVLLPKFWCKHMPPNFGIKMILFQNFYLSAHRVAITHSKIYA